MIYNNNHNNSYSKVFNKNNYFNQIQYLAAPREDDRPYVAAVEVLGAVEEHAGRLHGHGGHLRGWEKFVVRT